MFTIRQDDMSGQPTRDLLAQHLAGMAENSPVGSVFALDLSGLLVPEVTVWSAWRHEKIAGIGALKMLRDGNGEVKSMRTHQDFLRMGVAALILDTIIREAGSRGCRRISLETGSGPAFAPALQLYRRRGFDVGAPFGAYTKSDFNQFLHLDLG